MAKARKAPEHKLILDRALKLWNVYDGSQTKKNFMAFVAYVDGPMAASKSAKVKAARTKAKRAIGKEWKLKGWAKPAKKKVAKRKAFRRKNPDGPDGASSALTGVPYLWEVEWENMPMSPPGGRTAKEALLAPGNAVKSKSRRGGRFSRRFGKLARIDDEGVVVISHPGDPKFVWSGTRAEYIDAWDVD